MDHLFLHCRVVWELWSFVFQSFGIDWVFLDRIMELLFGWWNWFGKTSSGVWNLVTSCLMWTIWQERSVELSRILRTLLEKLLKISLAPCLIGLVYGG